MKGERLVFFQEHKELKITIKFSYRTSTNIFNTHVSRIRSLVLYCTFNLIYAHKWYHNFVHEFGKIETAFSHLVRQLRSLAKLDGVCENSNATTVLKFFYNESAFEVELGNVAKLVKLDNYFAFNTKESVWDGSPSCIGTCMLESKKTREQGVFDDDGRVMVEERCDFWCRRQGTDYTYLV